MALGSGRLLARKGGGEEGNRHDGDFWQNRVSVPSFLVWKLSQETRNCSCPITLFFSPSLCHLELSCYMSLGPCLDLSWMEGKEGMVILSGSPNLSTKGRSYQRNGYWGENDGNLRGLLEEPLLLAARPVTYRPWNLEQLTVFYFFFSAPHSI